MFIGVISDLHIPFENKRKLDLVLSIFDDICIDWLILNGDIADFYTINSHGPKSPEVRQTIDTELIALENFLSHVSKRYKKVSFVMGNHEFRLERYILNYCPAFYNHLLLRNLIDFEKMGIDITDYNLPLEVAPGLKVQHSPPSYSENHANTSFKKKLDENHIFGCTHRPDWVDRKGSSGKIYQTHMLGWFGEIGHIQEMMRKYPENKKVFQFTKFHDQWGCSFATIGLSERQHINQYKIYGDEISGYECVVGRNLYKG